MNWSKVNHILNISIFILIIGYIFYYFYKQPKFYNGEKAKNFSAILISGDEFKLSNLEGRYVLLDFWGSWCGPCRKENSELLLLHKVLKDKHYIKASGFDIVSIGIETNEVSWKKAITHDGLNWPYHICEMDRFSSPIATLYGVKEIPTKYFLGPEGTIIFVNPTVSEIKQYLLEQEEVN